MVALFVFCMVETLCQDSDMVNVSYMMHSSIVNIHDMICVEDETLRKLARCSCCISAN